MVTPTVCKAQHRYVLCKIHPVLDLELKGAVSQTISLPVAYKNVKSYGSGAEDAQAELDKQKEDTSNYGHESCSLRQKERGWRGGLYSFFVYTHFVKTCYIPPSKDDDIKNTPSIR